MKSISVADASAPGGWGYVVRLDQRFAPMMGRLEHAAKRDPAKYERKVVAAGFLGYAVLAAVILVLAGLTITMAVTLFMGSGGGYWKIKALLVFGLLAFGLSRALWVTKPEPEGVSVSRVQFPRLFSMIDDVRAATGGPPVHDVRIVDQLNAAITQQPRFMFFGAENTLYLGLPLLLAMTTDEVRAVVAHEFGHFVGRHGKSAGFVYRIRVRWAQVAERLPSGIVAGLLRKFFAWYGPWFAAYSFALARQQEYDADRVAAQMAGARTSANALARLAVQSTRYGSAWSEIWSGTTKSSEPPVSPYRELARHFVGSRDRDGASLASATATPADIDDTHPSLQQRLTALECAVEMPPPLETSAAEDLLGEELDAMIASFDSDWHAAADSVWEAEYRDGEEKRVELASLQARITSGSATSDDRLTHALLVEQFEGSGPAMQAYRNLLEVEPDNSRARFNLGRLLLDADDDEGVGELDRAARELPAAASSAYGTIASFLHGRGRSDEAARYQSLLNEAYEADALAAKESSNIDQTTVLEPLNPELREHLISLSSEIVGVESLHAAVRHLSNGQRQVIFVFSAARDVDSATLLDCLIDAMLPAGDLLGIERSAQRRWLTKKVEGQPGSDLLNRA